MPRQREPRLCAHTARSASCQTAVAFPSQCKMLSTSRSGACGLLSVTTLSPVGLGEVTLPRAEMLPPVTEAEIRPEAGAAPEPTPLFPRATLSRAGRKGRKHPAAACRTQEGPDLA